MKSLFALVLFIGCSGAVVSQRRQVTGQSLKDSPVISNKTIVGVWQAGTALVASAVKANFQFFKEGKYYMGAYNVLITEMICPNCGVSSPVQIQYKYGNTRQLQYKIGDTITWGGNEIGKPALTNVKAYGIAESTICPSCNEDKIPEDYDVYIKDNVIIGIAPMKNNDYLIDNGTYIDLNK